MNCCRLFFLKFYQNLLEVQFNTKNIRNYEHKISFIPDGLDEIIQVVWIKQKVETLLNIIIKLIEFGVRLFFKKFKMLFG